MYGKKNVWLLIFSQSLHLLCKESVLFLLLGGASVKYLKGHAFHCAFSYIPDIVVGHSLASEFHVLYLML